jgi:arylsulfatase A-like enzyme
MSCASAATRPEDLSVCGDNGFRHTAGMKPSSISRFAMAVLLLMPRVASSAAAPAPSRLPNLVIIFADDLGYADVGVFGARGFKTPNLDRLAREGRRFTDFYVAQAVCSASRAALLTGCYPNRIGISGALGPGARHGLSSNEMTIAELVKQRGYATAIFGKWHLGHHPEFLPTRHGFDEYFGLPYSNDMWPFHPEAKPGTYPDLPLIEDDKVIGNNPDQSKLTTWYTEHAVGFIERNRDRPFLLYVAHNMPHVPLFVSDKFKDKSKRGLYGDVIQEIDWSVGQILETLRKHNLDRDTLVVFMSDNGPWLSYGDHAGSAGRLREGKGTAWEGGVRVPCVMRWPGRIPARSVCREPAMTIDILPTIARLIEAKLPSHQIDGKDIWPLISGEPKAMNPHDAYFFYYNVGELQAVRSGPWKLIFPHTYRTLSGKPGGTGGIPSKYESTTTGLALFDLEKDLGETTNVVAQHPDVVKRLEALAEKTRDDLGDSLLKRPGNNLREPGRLAGATPTP